MYYNINFNEKDFTETIASYNEFLAAVKGEVQTAMMKQIAEY